MNLCTDELLLSLVAPARIVTVTHLVKDPRNSTFAEAATAIPANHGLAEQIMRLKPDLVVAGTFTTREARILLRRLGYTLLELPPANAISEIYTNLRTLAAATGDAGRAEDIIAGMKHRLTLDRRGDDPRPRALILVAAGRTGGPGTLLSDVLEQSGHHNVTREIGLTGFATVPLESVVRVRPDRLVFSTLRNDSPSLAREILEHPAIRRAAETASTVTIPGNLWTCGAPPVAEAVARLSAAGGSDR